MPKSSSRWQAAERDLRDFALSFPETREEFPWGDRVVKVKGKVFVFLGRSDGGEFGLSVKLPSSGMVALGLVFASPTRYGLGKSGWVTARFAPGEEIPVPLLREWIAESYRAVAPAKVLAALDAGDVAKPGSAAKVTSGSRSTTTTKRETSKPESRTKSKPKAGPTAGRKPRPARPR